ncbi:hypothetical protein BDW62DRAFT_205378 [Aspergillus aurantiobrunneus]
MASVPMVPSWLGPYTQFMNPHSDSLGALIATTSLSRGIRCVFQPGSQYYEFGIPREGSTDPLSRTEGAISPLIYVRGIREIGYSLSVYRVWILGNAQALTVLIGVAAFMSAGDMLVVLIFGRNNKQMVCYHLLVAAYFAMLYSRRT